MKLGERYYPDIPELSLCTDDGRSLDALLARTAERQRELCLPPHTMHPLVIDLMTLPSEQGAGSTISIARMLRGNGFQLGQQRAVRAARFIADAVTTDPHKLTTPALGDFQLHVYPNRLTPLRGGHHFFAIVSFMASISMALSANNRFKRAFSRSSSRKCLASVTCMPPYFCRHLNGDFVCFKGMIPEV